MSEPSNEAVIDHSSAVKFIYRILFSFGLYTEVGNNKPEIRRKWETDTSHEAFTACRKARTRETPDEKRPHTQKKKSVSTQTSTTEL